MKRLITAGTAVAPGRARHRHRGGAAADPVRPGAGAALRGGAAAAVRLLLGAGTVALERLSLCLVRRSLGLRRTALRPVDSRPLAVERLPLHLGAGTLGLRVSAVRPPPARDPTAAAGRVPRGRARRRPGVRPVSGDSSAWSIRRPRVTLPGARLVVPERVDGTVRMHRADRVGQAVPEQAAEARAALRAHQRIGRVTARRAPGRHRPGRR